MFETYRMLGAEREADLLREARRLHALPSGGAGRRVARALSAGRRLVTWLRGEMNPPLSDDPAPRIATD